MARSSSSTKMSTSKGIGCMVLFGLPFALGGLFTGGLAIKSLLHSFEARSWVEVPAEVLEVDLEVNSGSDSTTYAVKAKYRYAYQGQDFTGSRVSFHGGSDNIGSFHEDTARLLRSHQSQERPVPCYVNPDDPEEAVLIRQVRWGVVGLFGLFGVLFGGVGFGIIIFSLVGGKKVKKDELTERENPLEPWKWKADWAAGRIPSGNKKMLFFSAGFALFWNLISLPVLFLVPAEITEKGNYLAALGFIFPLVGIGLIVWAVRSFLRWQRFGESLFEMPRVPGVVGGPLAGVVRATMRRPPNTSFLQTLSCIRIRRTGSGKNRSTSEKVLWQDKHRIRRSALSLDSQGISIPVLFAIPYDARETDEKVPDDRIVWRLQVDAEVPGIDYSATFEVPVFTTEESSPTFQAPQQAIEAVVEKTSDEDLLRQSGIHISPLPGGGRRFDFPMARHPGQALGGTVFLVIWSGVIALMLHFDASFFFPLIFGLFGLLLGIAVLEMWLGIQQIEAAPRGLVLRSGLVAPFFVRTLGQEDIAEVRAVEGMRSGNRVFYDIKVRSRGSKERSIGKRLGEKNQAELIVRLIDQSLRGEGE